MKIKQYIIGFLAGLLVTAAVFAAPAPYAVSVDSYAAKLPTLTAYYNNTRTFRATFFDNGIVTDTTNYTTYLYWSRAVTNTPVYTSTVAVVGNTTNGTSDFTFTASQLATNGIYVYEAGLILTSNSNRVTYGQGTFTINRSL